jgi:hypothetical protein
MNKRHLELRVRARDAIDVARAMQLESRRIVARCMEARVEARRAVSS